MALFQRLHSFVLFICVVQVGLALFFFINSKYGYRLAIFKKEIRQDNVVQRIDYINQILELRRQKWLNSSNVNETTLFVNQEPLVFLDEMLLDVFKLNERLKNFSCVQSINFEWIDDNKESQRLQNISFVFDDTPNKNSLIKKYYRFTGSDPICQGIEKNQLGKNYGVTFNYTCNNDTSLAVPIDLDPLTYNLRHLFTTDRQLFPGYMFEFPKSITLMRVFVNSLISNQGEPFCDNVQIKLNDCLSGHSSRPTTVQQKQIQYHEEVFVIVQFWGEGYFHGMIEDIPRLALFLDFLLKHPGIKILASKATPQLDNILKVLGISSDRIITGWTRAKIAYVPRATSCGTANLLEIQFLNSHYRKYILKNLLRSSEQKKDKIILIKRSGHRAFTEHGLIENYLRAIAAEFGFKFIVFRDNPRLPFNDTMITFGSASIIVAPHGAGLSNMLFSQPGTFVIEGVCNPPHTNMCYQRLAHVLGLRWHGIISSSGCQGTVNISAKMFDSVIREYLKIVPIKELLT